MPVLSRPSATASLAAGLAIAMLVGISGCAYESAREKASLQAPEMDYDAAEPAAPQARSMEAGVAMDEAMSPPAPVGMNAAEAASVDRKVIKTGNVHVEVKSLEAAQRSIVQLVDQVGGFMQSMNVTDYETSRNAEIVARVPSDHFAGLYESVKALGKVERDHIGGQDVTQEYMDLERRIANFQAQEERVREMFNDAKTVEELLTVEQRLTEVRGQIEQLQGRLRFLKDQTGFSTLTITLYERGMAPIEQPESWMLGYHLRGAWMTLARAFRGLVYGVIWIVVAGAVVWLPLLIVIWLLHRWAIRHRAASQTQEQPPSDEA